MARFLVARHADVKGHFDLSRREAFMIGIEAKHLAYWYCARRTHRGTGKTLSGVLNLAELLQY